MKLLRRVARVKNPRPRVSFSGIVSSARRHGNIWAENFSKQKLLRAARVMGPTMVALTFAGVAHAQGTMDFSGAQTLMGTFNMGSAAVQSQVEMPYRFEVVPEQPVRAFQCERATIGYLDQRFERWMFMCSREIRQQISHRRLSAFVCTLLPLIQWFGSSMQFPNMR